MLNKVFITLYCILLLLFPEGMVIGCLSYSKILYIFTSLLILYNIIVEKKKIKFEKNFLSLFSIGLIMFSAWILLDNVIYSFINKQFLLTDFYEVLRPLLYVGIIILFNFTSSEEKKYIKKLFLVLIFINCLLAFTQRYNFFNMNELYIRFTAPSQYITLVNGYSNPRVVGLTSNPNIFGFLLSISLVITLYELIVNKKNVIYLFLFFIQFITLIMTMSRTSFICYIIMILFFVYVFFLKSKGFKYSILPTILVLLVSIGMLYILPEQLTWRIRQIINISELNSWEERVDNNKDNIDNILDSDEEISSYLPVKTSKTFQTLFGVGSDKLKQYGLVYDNEYLIIVYRYGFIGLCLYLLIFLFPLFQIKKVKESVSILYCSLFIGLLIYMYPAAIYHSMKLFPVICLVLALYFEKKQTLSLTKKDKSVLYINYVDLNNQVSGSSVRPKMIYEAFKQKGYNVKMLSGAANKTNKKERINKIKEISKWLDHNTVDFCYIESPSGVLYLKEDRDLIRKIYDKKIKIGYFYRDIYYKFSKEIVFNNQKINIFSKKYIKNLIHRFNSYRDNRLIRNCVDVVFLPSKSIENYLSFKKMVTLPPAGMIRKINNDDKKSIIYVGGVSLRYGTDLLLEAMRKVNEKQHIQLILICREKEKQYISKKYLKEKWLKVYHVSGEKNLSKYYNKSKLAIIPILKCEYNDFAVSVKLFEYMSYNIPIISTDCNEHERIIKEGNIGVICSCDSSDMADKILKLYNDEKKIGKIKYNMAKFLEEKNLWIHRIDIIESYLK